MRGVSGRGSSSEGVWFKSGDKVNVVPQKAQALVRGLERKTLEEKAAQIGEATGVSFCFEEQADGILITVRGKAAHASTPEEGAECSDCSFKDDFHPAPGQKQGKSDPHGAESALPYEDTKGKSLGIWRQEENSGSVTVCFSILEYGSGRVRGTV